MPYYRGVVSSRSWLILLVAVFGALSACSSSSDPGEQDAGERSLEQILTDASAAMTDVDSAAFTIEQSGATVFIDDAEQLGFQSAEGRFAAPSSAEALITVDALGFTTEVGAIAIDGMLWFTNPLSGAWIEAPDSFTFDPALLFDADQGLPVLLTEAKDTAELVEDSPVSNGDDAGNRNHVRTTVAADRVSVLTGGLVVEPTEVDLWIETDADRVVEARFDLTVGDGVSNWRMTISDYDADVTIAPPDLGDGD